MKLMLGHAAYCLNTRCFSYFFPFLLFLFSKISQHGDNPMMKKPLSWKSNKMMKRRISALSTASVFSFPSFPLLTSRRQPKGNRTARMIINKLCCGGGRVGGNKRDEWYHYSPHMRYLLSKPLKLQYVPEAQEDASFSWLIFHGLSDDNDDHEKKNDWSYLTRDFFLNAFCRWSKFLMEREKNRHIQFSCTWTVV